MFENRRIGTALALPAAVFVALAFLLPVGILLSGSVKTPDGWSLSLFGEFFADPLSVEVMWRTLRLGALVTFTSAVLGYIAALAIVQAGPTWKGRFVGLVVLPLMISPVARTYAWIVILGRTGVVNQAIMGLGLSDEPIRILFTETAVFIGLVQLFLPLMVLSLVSSLENLPADVVQAARVLGAGWFSVFFKVILPLTREGLVTGGTLVFTGAVTAYITPAVLGGSKVLMLETLLYQKVSVNNDFVSASVIAAILIAMGIVTHMLLKRAAKANPDERPMNAGLMRLGGWAVLAAIFLFLMGPFLLIAAAGLSAGDTLAFPPQGLSLRWFQAVFAMDNFRASFALSMQLAVGSTLLALLLGVPAAYGLSRYQVPGRELFRTIVFTPVIVPGIIVGLALLRHAVIPLDMSVTVALVLAHTVLVVPYAVRVVTASLENLRPDVEEAAVMLGATRLSTFFRVVLPNIMNGILAAFILGFVTSFNQVPVSLFLTGPGITTLPIDMLASMEFVYDPSIAALSALMALMSMLIVLVAERVLGLSRYV